MNNKYTYKFNLVNCEKNNNENIKNIITKFKKRKEFREKYDYVFLPDTTTNIITVPFSTDYEFLLIRALLKYHNVDYNNVFYCFAENPDEEYQVNYKYINNEFLDKWNCSYIDDALNILIGL